MTHVCWFVGLFVTLKLGTDLQNHISCTLANIGVSEQFYKESINSKVKCVVSLKPRLHDEASAS